jgi:hypothetical protein
MPNLSQLETVFAKSAVKLLNAICDALNVTCDLTRDKTLRRVSMSKGSFHSKWILQGIKLTIGIK